MMFGFTDRMMLICRSATRYLFLGRACLSALGWLCSVITWFLFSWWVMLIATKLRNFEQTIQ